MLTRVCKALFVIALSGALSSACLGQDAKAEKPEKPELKFYKLEFVVKEMENGKVLNARSYSTMASTGEQSFIRTGEKIPVPVQTGATGSITQTVDIGTNIDCRRIQPVQNELSLFINADVSGTPEASGAGGQPIIRHYQWSSGIVIPVRKPTVIFSSDRITGKGQMQLELTATPIP